MKLLILALSGVICVSYTAYKKYTTPKHKVSWVTKEEVSLLDDVADEVIKHEIEG